MNEDKNKDELEQQLDQATENAQSADAEQITNNQETSNDSVNTDGTNVNDNKGGVGQSDHGVAPDLGTAKEQMKEDGIEIL
jgi:hypothetical protein